MMRFAAGLAAAAFMCMAPAVWAAAQPPSLSQAPTEVEGVLVTAPPAAEAIRAFVHDVAAPTDEGRLARWNREVCPRTAGLPQKYATYLNDELARVALSVGLQVGGPKCHPNVLILLTGDADRLLQTLSTQYRDLFAVDWASNSNLDAGGGQTFASFIGGSRPVRWWHVTRTVPADGLGDVSATTMRVFSPSRLRSTMREDFNRVVLVIDVKQAQGVSYKALASYVAMVALAQLNPEADTRQVPTILNLFAHKEAGQPAEGLTAWDQAYLAGLYRAPVDLADLKRQRREIIRRMPANARSAGR